ncbi:MAG: hypothetical protein AAFU54_20545 [Chloroflexota bacterium]
MLVVAVVFFVLGLGFVVLSRYRGESVGRFMLPSREVRRVWLPGGLLLTVFGTLLVVLFTTTLPSSPLRMAETRNQQTREENGTMGVHTAYFNAHTNEAFLRTGTTTGVPPAPVTPLPQVNYSDFERTATVIFYQATGTAGAINVRIRGTNRALALQTIEGGDPIALTATQRRTLVTATSTLDATETPTPTLLPRPPQGGRVQGPRGAVTDFELTATALIVQATQSSSIQLTVQAAADNLTATANADAED